MHYSDRFSVDAAGILGPLKPSRHLQIFAGVWGGWGQMRRTTGAGGWVWTSIRVPIQDFGASYIPTKLSELVKAVLGQVAFLLSLLPLLTRDQIWR